MPACSRPLLAVVLSFTWSCSTEGGSQRAEDDGAAGAPSTESLYAIATAVSDDSGSTTYVKLIDELQGELDLSTAREFPGWSDIGAIGGAVFVSSGEEPTVYRFEIDEHNHLKDDGEIGFGAYVDDANFYNQVLVSDTKAYLIGENEYVVWNPSTLKITGTFPMPDLPERENILPFVGLDRAAVIPTTGSITRSPGATRKS